MSKYRVIKLNRTSNDFDACPRIGHIIEADSECGAIRNLADRMRIPTQWFKAERIILSDADRHYFLQPE